MIRLGCSPGKGHPQVQCDTGAVVAMAITVVMRGAKGGMTHARARLRADVTMGRRDLATLGPQLPPTGGMGCGDLSRTNKTGEADETPRGPERE